MPLYTKRWAVETCQQFFGLSAADVAQIAGAHGQTPMLDLWQRDPAGFYEHPWQVLRQEWWHMTSGMYPHPGFWAALPDNAHILDYGCGTGEVIRPWLMMRQDSASVVVLAEPSVTCRAYLAHKYASVLAAGMDVRIASAPLSYPPDTFDAVICTDVLEHVPDPMPLQRALWATLKPGGHALLKMETAYPHAGHLREAVEQFPIWKQWLFDHTELIEVETYGWVRKPEKG